MGHPSFEPRMCANCQTLKARVTYLEKVMAENRYGLLTGIIRVQGRAKGTFTARDFPEIGPLKAFRLMRHMQQAGEIELVEEGKRGRWGYPAKYRFTE